MIPITIITTSYNRENYLSQSIESVLNSSEPNFELLIWDDGSTDTSPQIAQKYALADRRVKAISASHQGSCLALAQAMLMASGQYIGWLDSDDWISPECLSKTKAVLDNTHEIGMVYTNYADIAADGTNLGLGARCILPYSPTTLLFTFLTFHFRLFRREIYDKVGGINQNLKCGFDYDFCLKVSEISQIYHLEELLYFYRTHPANISTSKADEQTRYAGIALKEALIRRGYYASLCEKINY